MSNKLSHLDGTYVKKDIFLISESRCKDLESKLDYEKSLRTRFEVCILASASLTATLAIGGQNTCSQG